jgi:hypothetical protein
MAARVPSKAQAEPIGSSLERKICVYRALKFLVVRDRQHPSIAPQISPVSLDCGLRRR